MSLVRIRRERRRHALSNFQLSWQALKSTQPLPFPTQPHCPEHTPEAQAHEEISRPCGKLMTLPTFPYLHWTKKRQLKALCPAP